MIHHIEVWGYLTRFGPINYEKFEDTGSQRLLNNSQKS